MATQKPEFLCGSQQLCRADYETSTLAETLEFTNRQSIISRVYFPPLWWGAAIAHSISTLFIVIGLAGAIAWLAAGGTANLILAGCLVLLLLQLLNAALMLGSVPQMLPDLALQINRRRMRYLLCAPLASWMSMVNTAYSLCTRRIVWRGIRYELVSATETRVL